MADLIWYLYCRFHSSVWNMKYYKVLGYLDNDVILYENNDCNIARDMIKCNYRDEKICFIVNDSNLNYSK